MAPKTQMNINLKSHFQKMKNRRLERHRREREERNLPIRDPTHKKLQEKRDKRKQRKKEEDEPRNHPLPDTIPQESAEGEEEKEPRNHPLPDDDGLESCSDPESEDDIGDGKVREKIIIDTNEYRKIIKYNEYWTEEYKQDGHDALHQIKQLARGSSGGHRTYEPQEECSHQVFDIIRNQLQKLFIMVIGLCQSGKTGLIRALVKDIYNNDDYVIPTDNIVVITGLSSRDWKKQMGDRIPPRIKVFHRNQLRTEFINYMKTKQNIILLIDEIQVACGVCQTVYDVFKELNYLDSDFLMENNIVFVEISATPNGLLNDLMEWDRKNFELIQLQAGNDYSGVREFLDQGRIYEYKDLCGWKKKKGTKSSDRMGEYYDKEGVLENIKELKEKIDSYEQCKYHLVRTRNGIEQLKTQDNFNEVFGISDYKYLNYDSKNCNKIFDNGKWRKEDINDLTKNPPKDHTIIFLKEKLRCSHTLDHKDNFGVLYDRHVNKSCDSVTVQGMAGRMCGYNIPKHLVCYTNKEGLKNYRHDWDNGFNINCSKMNIREKKKTYNSKSHREEKRVGVKRTKYEEISIIPIRIGLDMETYNICREGFKEKRKGARMKIEIRTALRDYCLSTNNKTITNHNEYDDNYKNTDDNFLLNVKTKNGRYGRWRSLHDNSRMVVMKRCFDNKQPYTDSVVYKDKENIKDWSLFVDPYQKEDFVVYVFWRWRRPITKK